MSRFKFSRSVPIRRVRNRVPLSVRAAGELKYFDIAATNYQADTTGSVTVLNAMVVGDDNNTRDGRQISNTSLHVQGVVFPQDTTTNNTVSRLMLIWDSQPNGAIAAVTDVLTAANSISTTNLNNRERFRILRDIRNPHGAVSDVATQTYSNANNTHVINEFISLKGLKTTYNATAAGIASVTTGALLMLTIGSAASTAGATYTLTTRLRFTDN